MSLYKIPESFILFIVHIGIFVVQSEHYARCAKNP